MLTDVKTTLKTTWERLMHAADEEKPLTAYEQTRFSWARPLASCAEVPEVYQDFLRTLPDMPETPPFAVLTPTYPGFVRRENEKLVCTRAGKVYILEKTRDRVIPTIYAFADINYVETGAVLLDGRLKISGVACDGRPATSALKFNVVTDYLFRPIVDKFRAAAGCPIEVDHRREMEKFDGLILESFKYMNYGRHSILAGERVVQFVFQPEIRSKILSELGRSLSRTVAVSHLLMLPDRELILIREDEKSPKWRDGARYGGFHAYIPLHKIVATTLTEVGADLLNLSIWMPCEDHIDTLFAMSKREELHALLKQIESLKRE